MANVGISSEEGRIVEDERVIGMINIAYITASAISGIASFQGKTRGIQRWWSALSLGLLSLGLLRAAQAGIWIDSYLQQWLRLFGWYEDRRYLQVAAIIVFAVCLLFGFMSAPAVAKRERLLFATVAFYALMIFGAIRASSLHWSDAVLGQQIGRISLSHVMQAVLLIGILGACVLELRSADRPQSAV